MNKITSIRVKTFGYTKNKKLRNVPESFKPQTEIACVGVNTS